MATQCLRTRDVFKGAHWIWPTNQGFDLVNYFMQARRVFDLARLPRRCIVKVTADSRYVLYVNGAYAGRGPARGFQSHWPYDEVDIASYLEEGANCIALLATNYGSGTYQYVSGGSGAAILSGRVGKVDLSTGRGWRVRRSPAYARHMTRLSVQLAYEELFDARLDDGSWTLPSYREPAEVADPLTSGDLSWREPRLSASGVMPWPFVEPRGIPLPSGDVVLPSRIVGECEGRSARYWRETTNVTETFLRDEREWRRAPLSSRGQAIPPLSLCPPRRETVSFPTPSTSALRSSGQYASKPTAPPEAKSSTRRSARRSPAWRPMS